MDNKINATQTQLADPKWWDEHAPDGATHWEPESYDFIEGFMKKDGDTWYFWDESVGWKHDHNMDDDEGQRVNSFLSKPQQELIPGVTLPPVGTKCRIHLTEPSFYQKTYPTVEHGMEVEIIQHLDTGKGEVAVFKYLNESDWGEYYCVAQAIAECFVPLKTKEQIEEEETKKVIAQVVCDWLRQSSNINRFEKLDAIANLLYKEGLRIVK